MLKLKPLHLLVPCWRAPSLGRARAFGSWVTEAQAGLGTPAAAAAKEAEDGQQPVAEIGGWYSPGSIERRLNRPPRKADAPRGRTTPLRSEEDFWFAAGAPGYDEHRGHDVPAAQAASGAESQPSATPADVTVSVPATAAATAPAVQVQSPAASHSTLDVVLDKLQQLSLAAEEARLALKQHSAALPAGTAAPADATATSPSSSLPVVREVSVSLPFAKLPLFLQVYRNMVLPSYAEQEGMLHAQLLAAGLPMGMSLGQLTEGAYVGGRAANMQATIERKRRQMEAEKARGKVAADSKEEAAAAGGPSSPVAETVQLRNLTVWASEESLQKAGESPSYQQAMQELARFFASFLQPEQPPTSSMLTELAVLKRMQ